MSGTFVVLDLDGNSTLLSVQRVPSEEAGIDLVNGQLEDWEISDSVRRRPPLETEQPSGCGVGRIVFVWEFLGDWHGRMYLVEV